MKKKRIVNWALAASERHYMLLRQNLAVYSSGSIVLALNKGLERAIKRSSEEARAKSKKFYEINANKKNTKSEKT